jgi:hypothetical protein
MEVLIRALCLLVQTLEMLAKKADTNMCRFCFSFSSPMFYNPIQPAEGNQFMLIFVYTFTYLLVLA